MSSILKATLFLEIADVVAVQCTGQPARASYIPPAMDSLILDYQSPRAMPGFYPSEEGQVAAPRRMLLEGSAATPAALAPAITGVGEQPNLLL